MPSRVPSDLEEQTSKLSNGSTKAPNGANGSMNGTADPKKKDATTQPDANSRTEGKAEGSVKAATIHMYLSAMGPWYYWIAAVVIFVVH